MAYLVRHYAREMLDQEDSLRRRKKLERLNIVYQYIERNYSGPIGNRELADLIHVSEGRFSHLFKESAGMAPLQYINKDILQNIPYVSHGFYYKRTAEER